MRKKTKIVVVTLGSEIVSGRTLDTNSQFIAQLLNRNGFSVVKFVSIKDEETAISTLLAYELESANVVITTGGLGPTFDDITINAIAHFFDRKLIFNKKAYESIEAYFRERKWALTKARKKQAILPQGAEVLINTRGVAPGIILQHRDKHILVVPGVPHEMREMCESQVVPYLKKYFGCDIKKEISINTAGISESLLERKIRTLVKKNKRSSTEYGIYPHLGEVQIKVTITGATKKRVNDIAKAEINKFKKVIAPHIYGFNDDTLPSVVIDLLRKNKKTLAVAESCTGGLISKTITDIPGASRVFKGGSVAYSNQAKVELLDVPNHVIKKHGAVSAQVARYLAVGVCKRYSADYGIGVTGIAGPTGGSKEKPVGLVYIALAHKKHIVSFKYIMPRFRNTVRIATMKHALFRLIRFI
ncbi:competence/damage-inducible protein A [Candidatus Omnitrophota bacterium]